jgi:hypothetical protein
MAAGITTSFVGTDTGPQSLIGPEEGEIWRVTADASSGGTSGNTATITARNFRTITHVIGGPFSVAISAGVATLTLLATLGNSATVDVFVMGTNAAG